MYYHIISYSSIFIYFGCIIWLLIHTITSFKCRQNGLIPLCAILSSCYFTQNQLFASQTYDSYEFHLEIIHIALSLQIIPLFYFYVKISTKSKPLRAREYIILLPGVMLAFAITLLHYVIGHEDLSHYFHKISEVTNEYMYIYTHNPIRIFTAHSFLKKELYEVLIGLQYISVSIILIKSIAKRLIYANLNKSYKLNTICKDINLVGRLFILISLFVLYFFIQRHYSGFSLHIATVYLLLMGVLTSIICYKAPANGFIYSSETNSDSQANEITELNKEDKDANEASLSRNQILHRLFEEEVIKKKLYLQQSLKIEEVAILLNSNRTYVSSMISEIYHTTFPNCINNIRIEYAKKILIDNPNIKQEDIAIRSGFQNGPSFNRVFKQKEGVPPKTWLKNYITQTDMNT